MYDEDYYPRSGSARCPECSRSFRTMEDEPAEYCPYCGYTDEED